MKRKTSTLAKITAAAVARHKRAPKRSAQPLLSALITKRPRGRPRKADPGEPGGIAKWPPSWISPEVQKAMRDLRRDDAIKIESGIPIPPAYPFDALRVGDSFFVPGLSQRQLALAAYAARRRTKHRYTVRAVEEAAVKGARAWRVA